MKVLCDSLIVSLMVEGRQNCNIIWPWCACKCAWSSLLLAMYVAAVVLLHRKVWHSLPYLLLNMQEQGIGK